MSSASRIVVTGTDTGVGKTHIACALAHALKSAGLSVSAIKPIESGVSLLEPGDEDGARLAAATGQRQPRRALLRLSAPIAPPEAAEQEGVTIDLEGLLERAVQLADGADVCLIEAAGGLLSPLSWDGNALDVARRLGASTLLVSADRLGTVNHTLLSLSALDAAEIPVAGVVLSAPEHADASTGHNAAAIQRLAPGHRVVMAPREPEPERLQGCVAHLVRKLSGA